MRPTMLLLAMLSTLTPIGFTSSALAQRTRFPGDSPTRPAVMNGKVLGTPSGRRPNVPTFTIPQGGYYGFGSRYYWGYRSTGYYPSGCFYPSRFYPPYYYSSYYSPVQVVDYRTIYGLRPPMALNNNPPPVANQKPAPGVLLPPAPQVENPARAAQLKRAWRFIDLGDRHLKEGRLLDARRNYRRAQKAAHDLADVQFRLTFLELANGKFERAALALAAGLQLEPNWPQAPFKLDDVYSEKLRGEVLNLIDQQLKQFPNDADAQLLAGVVNHFQGNQPAAEQHFQHAMKVTGGNTVARLFVAEQPEARDAKRLLEK